MAMRRASAGRRVGRWRRTFDFRSGQALALATSRVAPCQVTVGKERPLEHLHTSAAAAVTDIKV